MNKVFKVLLVLSLILMVGCKSIPTDRDDRNRDDDREEVAEEVVEEEEEAESVDAIEPMVSTGGEHAVALKSDGSVWSWGSNVFGQLGSGRATIYNKDYEIFRNNDKLEPTRVFEDVIDIAAGDNYTLVLTKDNQLYGCGSNEYGQLGLDKYTNYPKMTLIAEDVISMDAGRHLSAYITDNDELYLLGLVKLYMHTDPDLVEGVDYTNKPKAIMSGVKDVALASDLMMIQTLDDELYVYGNESEYREQYADEDLIVYRNDKFTAEPIMLVESVKTIDSGDQVYMYTDQNDTLYTWGANGFDGQLGIGSSEFSVLEHTKVLENINDYNQQIAIDKNGDLYTWGMITNMVSLYIDQENAGGSVLDDMLDYGPSPTLLEGNMKMCAQDEGTFYAIDKDNNLYSWGVNIYGQIGDGTVTELNIEIISDGEYEDRLYTVAVENGKKEPIIIMNLDE